MCGRDNFDTLLKDYCTYLADQLFISKLIIDNNVISCDKFELAIYSNRNNNYYMEYFDKVSETLEVCFDYKNVYDLVNETCNY